MFLGTADTLSEPSSAATQLSPGRIQPMWDVFFHAYFRSNVTSVSMLNQSCVVLVVLIPSLLTYNPGSSWLLVAVFVPGCSQLADLLPKAMAMLTSSPLADLVMTL